MKKASPRFITRHPRALQIAMPLGGLGAGCICLNGYGGLQDFSINNRFETTALPDGHDFSQAAFALLHIQGKKPLTRLVEGPFPAEKIYDQSLQAQGYRHGGHEGLPRFRKSIFRGGYPFGRIELSDSLIPLKVDVTGWSPFIPGDDVASGAPCAIVEYTFKNISRATVDFEFSYHLSHLASGQAGWDAGGRNEVIPGKGIFFFSTEHPQSERYGSASLTVIGHKPAIKAMWLRGGWFDAISALWREVETGKFKPNAGRHDAGRSGRNGGSLLLRALLRPGEEMTYPILITWHFPNSNLVANSEQIQGPLPACQSTHKGKQQAPKWKTFYSSIRATANHLDYPIAVQRRRALPRAHS